MSICANCLEPCSGRDVLEVEDGMTVPLCAKCADDDNVTAEMVKAKVQGREPMLFEMAEAKRKATYGSFWGR